MLDHVTFRGDRLDEWMEARGISSADVAEQTGLTYNFLYLLRLNKRPNVSAENVTKIALTVGVTTDYLCNASDDPLGRASQGGPGEVELLLAFRSLSLYRQRDMLLIAQALAGQEETAEEKLSRALDVVRSLFGESGVEQITGALAGLDSIATSDPARLIAKKEEHEEEHEGEEALYEDDEMIIAEDDVARAIKTGRERMGDDYASLLDNEPILEDDNKKKRPKKR